jgi:hypothetical protein
MGLEVVVKFAPCEDHYVEQILDLQVTRLGFGQHFADAVHWPLDGQGVSLLRALYHDDGADHMGGRGDVEVQRLVASRQR